MESMAEGMIKDLVASGHALADDMTGAPSVLVRCLAAQLEVQLVRANALAAENAALKQSEKEFNNFCRQEYYGWEGNFTETPATDAFLAEVRAQGVEMYADNLDNGADDAERGGFDYAVKLLRSEASGVRLFADQLRKGGNQ
ncbi:hypothetical protein AB2I51_07435 [Escherichia coli]|nr:hypothetical protein [Escherichia coli]